MDPSAQVSQISCHSFLTLRLPKPYADIADRPLEKRPTAPTAKPVYQSDKIIRHTQLAI
jgi:hypothetical protein